MTELTLFASTFVLVFALGAQSINVNNGHYYAAAMTSFVIGAGQMILFKIAPDASWSEIAAFLGGGPLGITAVMWAHPRLVRLMSRKQRYQFADEDDAHLAPESVGMYIQKGDNK